MSCPVTPLQLVRPSVPVRNAVRLYVTGACKTKREAAAAVGLHPNYLTMLTGPNGSPAVKRYMQEVEEQLHAGTINMSHVMQTLGRKAALKVGELMESSQNERIVLDAAKELLDRSPETQKTQRLQVDEFTLDGKDVAGLIAAIAESRASAAEHAHAANGVVELSIDNFDRPQASLPLQQAEVASVDQADPSR